MILIQVLPPSQSLQTATWEKIWRIPVSLATLVQSLNFLNLATSRIAVTQNFCYQGLVLFAMYCFQHNFMSHFDRCNGKKSQERSDEKLGEKMLDTVPEEGAGDT